MDLLVEDLVEHVVQRLGERHSDHLTASKGCAAAMGSQRRGVQDEAMRVREREALSAMIRAVALNPSPAFELPTAVRRGPRGYWTTTSGHAPVALYAAVAGRVIEGETTPFLADLLAADAPANEIATRHGVTAPVLEAALQKLHGLGLLEH